MKVQAIIILSVFFSHALNAQNKFFISGTIPPQYKGAEITLLSENSKFESLITKEENGKFNLSGEIKQDYEPVYLIIRKDNVYLGGSFIFIGGREMKIDIVKLNVDKSLNDFRFFNVPFVKEQKIYDEMTKPLLDSAKVAFKPYDDVRLGYVKGHDKDSLWAIVSNLRKKLLVKKIKFIAKYPNDYISLYFFNKEIVNGYHPITVYGLETIYNKLGNDLKKTNLGKSVGEYLKKKKSITVGNVLPDFSFLDSKGQKYDLSSFFDNKEYVLLCFWSRGCAPCIKKMPTLKILNEKYASKGLNLISISLENNADWWLKSLKKYEMPWLQTCDVPEYNQGNSIAKILDVNRMPQYFLIDNSGKLIYHNEQSNDDDDFTVLMKILDSQLE
ncbi:MAG: thiol-disulfide isomerase/thioredoxin [Flavobacterium sp.]|jgi:thiol-disulfide isomerase/thioredoxin